MSPPTPKPSAWIRGDASTASSVSSSTPRQPADRRPTARKARVRGFRNIVISSLVSWQRRYRRLARGGEQRLAIAAPVPPLIYEIFEDPGRPGAALRNAVPEQA